MADNEGSGETAIAGLSARDVVNFVEQVQSELNLQAGDVSVFTLEIPDVPQQYSSALVAQASQSQIASAVKGRAMGICFPIDYNTSGQQYAAGALSPEYAATTYFGLYEKRTIDQPLSSSVELIASPKHGEIVYSKYHDGSLRRDYVPKLGYAGDDKVVFRVKVGETTVRLVYLLKVTKLGVDTEGIQDVLCKETGDLWKISLPDTPLDKPTVQSLLSFTGINAPLKSR